MNFQELELYQKKLSQLSQHKLYQVRLNTSP